MIDNVLLVICAAAALGGALLMLILREPMRVAIALISTMLALGAIYGLLGVHFLIYVGAVMVFMVYVIMLLDPRDPAVTQRFSKVAVPGVIVFVALVAVLVGATWTATPTPPAGAAAGFSLQQFAVAFLREYWLQFELTSVLLVAAIVAAVAVVRLNRRNDG